MTHELKILPMYFNCVENGSKPFEVRRNDRGFSVGDTLILREYEPNVGYSGRCLSRIVSYILDDANYCKNGFVVLGLREHTHMKKIDLDVLHFFQKERLQELSKEKNLIEYGKYMTDEEVIEDMKMQVEFTSVNGNPNCTIYIANDT